MTEDLLIEHTTVIKSMVYYYLVVWYQEGQPNPQTPTFIPNRLLNQEVHKALNTDKQLESC